MNTAGGGGGALKIAILGNCQSRPLAALLRRACPSITVLEPLIVHLLCDSDVETTSTTLADADLILTQPIEDAYPIEFARTSVLRDEFGDRLVVWPNLFFSGQCPDLVSVSPVRGPRLVGPLETYHSAAVLGLWRRGVLLDATLRMLEQDLVFSTAAIDSAVADSMIALKQRENAVDVVISDIIESDMRSRRLFFTYNHPTAALLAILCERLCDHCGLAREQALEPIDGPEPLGRIVAPTTRPMAAHLDLDFVTDTACVGVEWDASGETVVTGKSRRYTFSEFVEGSFRAYDVQLHPQTSLNTTPAYLGKLLDSDTGSSSGAGMRRAP